MFESGHLTGTPHRFLFDARVRQPHARSGGINTRVDERNARVGELNARVRELNARLGGFEARLGGFEARWGEFEARLGEFEAPFVHPKGSGNNQKVPPSL